MISAFSLPLFAAWALLDTRTPARVRSFRLLMTLAAALVMGVMVFVRQRMLDRELLRLVAHSQESFANLKRLQAQITESEKLASIGQLVGGAAHELNNPITAMLGYSDLLLGTSLTGEQNDLAEKIGQHIRRTRSLVASLLSFAKQGPAALAPVDLTTLLRTAVKLSQPQWQALRIDVRTEFPEELVVVLGDSNQLLQVCVQLINDALHVIDQYGNRTLSVVMTSQDGIAVIRISDTGRSGNSAATDEHVADSLETLSQLGLSACQGILRQHDGNLIWQQDGNTGTSIRVEIPIIPPTSRKSTEPVVPVTWQPQSFA
jgi:two-component system NtrC family sensor kinase